MHDNVVPPTSLLELPGELRNRIYDFVQEPDQVRLVYKPSLHHKQVEQTSQQFFGLTQVCRKLRVEYLPIYNAQTIVSIGCLHTASYVDTFILPAGVEPEQARGNLIVRTPAYHGESVEQRVPTQAIIDLIALSQKAPGVTIKFDKSAWFVPLLCTLKRRYRTPL
ncbi:hypothetical protein CC77DRAFT_300428 [Alternaria alternata]|uniref:F-box domain-containing protein n=2 Tax=Alternaria alternata complex TaxID=187734 RepID=A0A177E0Z3_ALTAL|nr:hypothetical protein CC77DRAFT_300428 [Alternaria alternata]KAH6841961.1 hypothetical protein B0T12DRAFT_271708 [Alternaria alternata]OAG25080.1 hypothetical protein CC77DRAFT_300428 [Alternaria alternata]RYN62101.1 hypothetical protein AA0114_g544 [Alternaria tenuissima]RYN85898.1 hypothetical protein AA0120_g8192 [Alternaria tenuissima]